MIRPEVVRTVPPPTEPANDRSRYPGDVDDAHGGRSPPQRDSSASVSISTEPDRTPGSAGRAHLLDMDRPLSSRGPRGPSPAHPRVARGCAEDHVGARGTSLPPVCEPPSFCVEPSGSSFTFALRDLDLLGPHRSHDDRSAAGA